MMKEAVTCMRDEGIVGVAMICILMIAFCTLWLCRKDTLNLHRGYKGEDSERVD